ncbi:hypothetical protein [Streptomyces sp. NPDC091383]|uniref:hypothetical protein n=1 Tax=Streptomyces sp. NPDC091383 TaxID=3365996 RepID=UPI0038157BEF
MPTLVCAACRSYLLNVMREEPMPKITVHGGPSIEGYVVDPETSEVTPIDVRLADGETVLSRDAVKGAGSGGEDVSAGTSSSTSSEKEQTSGGQSDKPGPSPAPTTANRSGKARTGSSTARPTDGGPADGTSATADK